MSRKQILIKSTLPEWMESEVIVQRMQERVQAIMDGLSFRVPDETVQVIANTIVQGYVAGYSDCCGMLEHEADAEEHVQRLADVLLAGEGGDDPDHFAIADMMRRVAAVIDARGQAAPAPRGPSA